MRIKHLLRTAPLLALLFTLLSSAPALAQDRGEGELRTVPPSGITVEEVIQRFATKEKEFKEARENYTWRQSVKVQTIDGNTVDGEYQSVVDILFDDKGRRQEQVVFAPQSSLQRVQMTREDFEDIEKRLPFVLTSDEIGLYDISYAGQQKQDELNTYVFDIKPKRIEKNQRYFEGRIWVDDHDFQIVKTFGKNVPDVVQKRGQENLFPKFTTYREQVDGRYWFPTYTRVDDTLQFSAGDVHIRQIVKYTNYKRFGSKSRITYEGQEIPGQSQQQAPQGQTPPPQTPK
ncbi:MAG TPA: hypothetical protein VN622_08095 [Clostridia bacterium]|nr:hypothetical protein [Clostridia bacterium]